MLTENFVTKIALIHVIFLLIEDLTESMYKSEGYDVIGDYIN